MNNKRCVVGIPNIKGAIRFPVGTSIGMVGKSQNFSWRSLPRHQVELDETLHLVTVST